MSECLVEVGDSSEFKLTSEDGVVIPVSSSEIELPTLSRLSNNGEKRNSTQNSVVNLSESRIMEGRRALQIRRYTGTIRRTTMLRPTSQPHVYSKWEKKQMKNYGSIVYNHPRSSVYQDFLSTAELADTSFLWKWFAFILIALMMSATAFTLKATTEKISEIRTDYLQDLLSSSDLTAAYFFHVGISLLLILISASVVIFWEPSASGSGIPEVIGYLNGIHIPNIFTPKVYVAKMISVIASVASGLPLGPEGPMIHIGGTIGASVESKNTILRKIVPWYQFRNQEDKRHFVLGGVASGVAAAFNAPIGGLAFAWEEISSFWEDKQAWMILFGCMLSAFLTNLLLSVAFDVQHAWSFTRTTILFSVPALSNLAIWIFIPAIVIGLIGGILGVIFTWIALLFARARRKHFFQNRWVKLAEPCIITILFMSAGFYYPNLFSCVPLTTNQSTTNTTIFPDIILSPEEAPSPAPQPAGTPDVSTVGIGLWLCPEGQYNPMAELCLQSGHDIINLLLSRTNPTTYSFEVLGAFLAYYFLFAAWCAGGVSFASGFVVPMIAVGAVYGRIVGLVMLMIAPFSEYNNPGLYALLGSAAFFGGVSRLSVSLTIIMIELSGDVLLAFPLMVSIMVAKNVADAMIHPLYHEQLALKGVPFLDYVSAISGIETLRAKDVMTGNVVVLHDVESVRAVGILLRDNDFSAFPVVSKGDLYYEGMISRKEIRVLLSRPDIFTKKPTGRPPKVLTWYEIKTTADTFDYKQELVISEEDGKKYIDFGPYINTGVFSIPINFLLKDAYNLFRTMALTHLIIVNRKNQLVGIITRKDLLGENIIMKKEKQKRKVQKGKLSSKIKKAFSGKEK